MKKIIFCVICAIGGLSLTSCDDYDIVETEYDEDMQVNPARESVAPPTIEADWNLELIPDVGRQADNLFVYKDLKYNQMFSRTLGWTGGDGGQSVQLPDGNIAWIFKESYYGTVDATNRARIEANKPLNAILIQQAKGGKLGETQADLVGLADYVNWTDATADNYLWARTFLRHPDAKAKGAAAIERGEIDTDQSYQAGAAIADGNKLTILWRGARITTGIVNRTAMTTYSLSGAIPTGRYISQNNDYLPQDGDYMAQTNINHEFVVGNIFIANTALKASDGHNYIYGISGTTLFVSRSQTTDLGSPWQYYVRNAKTGVMEWVDTYPTADEIARSGIMENGYVAVQPTVFEKDGTYYMVSQGSGNGTEVYIYSAPNPEGPFSNQQLLFNLPSFIDKIGVTTYGSISSVYAHPELSRSGELVISACTKAAATADNFTYPGSADFSRPYFFRVFNWQVVYD